MLTLLYTDRTVASNLNCITMSSNVVVCTIDQELKDQVKKFRYSKEKEGAAIIMKVSSREIYANLL